MQLSDFTRKLDKSNAEWIESSITYKDDTIEFLVKSKSYAADDEYIWIKREDAASTTEGLQRRIHRLVRVQADDGLDKIPLEDIECFPFDLLIEISNEINNVQGIETEEDDSGSDNDSEDSENSKKKQK